jgi:DNA-binding CsgD family transcriptional regulator
VLATTAELAAWRGDLERVRRAADAGLRLTESGTLPDPWLAWLAALVLRAEADASSVARARHDEAALGSARAIAGAVERRLGAFASAATGVRDSAILAQCRAELSRLVGHAPEDEWDEVARGWEAAGRPYPVAYARFRAAEAILTARGSRDRAAAELRAAAHTARRLGARPLLGEIERLARQARIELDPADGGTRAATGGSPPASGGPVASDPTGIGLTSREAEVLALVAAGWSNQQIADRLFITRKTASVHVSNILGKLGAANRVEAAAIAHRLGFGEADAPA